MYLLHYEVKIPNDSLCGPGYDWQRSWRSFKTREELVQGLAHLAQGDAYGNPTRLLRIYNAFPSRDEIRLFERAQELLEEDAA